MPKKINTEMKELGAAEFGALLQEGKIVKVRAGKAVIEHTRTVRKKKVVNTYHVNLQPQIVHMEVVLEEGEKAEDRPRKTATRKPATKRTTTKKTAKAPVKPRKKAGKPATKKETKPAKKTGGRKRRTKKTEQTAAPPKPATEKKTTASAQIPWNEELDDNDFEL